MIFCMWIFSKKNLQKIIKVEKKKEKATVYSIVNTLCELTEVNKIKILINGEKKINHLKMKR